MAKKLPEKLIHQRIASLLKKISQALTQVIMLPLAMSRLWAVEQRRERYCWRIRSVSGKGPCLVTDGSQQQASTLRQEGWCIWHCLKTQSKQVHACPSLWSWCVTFFYAIYLCFLLGSLNLRVDLAHAFCKPFRLVSCSNEATLAILIMGQSDKCNAAGILLSIAHTHCSFYEPC